MSRTMPSGNSRKKAGRTPEASPQVAMEVVEGRIPPQAIEIEKVVLGALLLEKDAYARVSDLLTTESFYVKAHEIIYQAVLTLTQKQYPVDILTVSEELKRTGQLEMIGGNAYLAELTTHVSGASNLEHHAHIVAQKSLSRRLISFSSEVLTHAYEDEEDIEDQLERAQGVLFDLSQNNLKKQVRPIGPLIKETVQEIQVAANRTEGISGITSGFPGIDKMTSGWQRSDLIIIAARPAMGKTAFVLSMAKNMAVDHDIPVAVFNLEMSAIQVVKRLITNVCEIPGEVIKNGRLEQHQWVQLDTKIKELEQKPLYIDDTPSLSIFELRTKARILASEFGIKVIIIDYLQLMNASGMNFGNREQEVSMVSRSLKILAKELNIPIIALSQLNRSVETRKAENSNSKRPQLSDLRESGAIEQDADIVCFIHRPEYYKIYVDDDGNPTEGIAEFIIAKHRNGPVGDVRLSFRSEFVKFLPLEAESMVTRASRVNNSAASKVTSSGVLPPGNGNTLSGGLSEVFQKNYMPNDEDDDLPY